MLRGSMQETQKDNNHYLGGISAELDTRPLRLGLEQVDILISKNKVVQILYLKHHDNVFKT